VKYSMRRGVLGLALVAAALTGAGPAAAQEFGVILMGSSSDMTQLDAASGFGVFVRMFPNSFTAVRTGVQHAAYESDRVSRVCGSYTPTPSFNCQDEPVRTRTGLTSLLLSTALRYRPLRNLEIELGGGGSMNQVRIDEDSESGRATSLVVKESAQWGLLLIGGARLRPVARLPFTIDAGTSMHRLNLTACAEGEPRDELYCRTVNMREFRIGIGYDLGW
jgi:hypothetical protein